MKRKGIVYMLIILISLFMLPNNHLNESYGDKLFQSMGIPVWTENNQSGFHLSLLVFLSLLIFGISRTVKLYRPTFPKILSRIILSCIAFILLFPIVSEKMTFMLKKNTTGIYSIDYNKKDSACSFNWEERTVSANCKFTFFNYGKEERIAVKPIFENNAIDFEEQTFSIAPHDKVSFRAQFDGKYMEGTGRLSELYDLHISELRGFGVEVQAGDEWKQFY
ncbi:MULTISPECIES: hypothetical protein [unclassified Paenibacillus]|uniref:hypothetical protein n=1 Tax=unclassified Paenibacillus TaxID=185978 RepID=UPI002F3FF0E5